MSSIRPTHRTLFRTATAALLAFIQASLAVSGTVKIDEGVNARSSLNFWGTSNIQAVFPKGTEGEVLERWELPSGNHGIKLKVISLGGPSQNLHLGDEVWVYYHRDPERRRVELYDDENSKVENAADGKWAVALQSFRIRLPEPEKEKICESCNTISANLASVVQPIARDPLAEFSMIFTEVARTIEAPTHIAPLLDTAEEEIATYLASIYPKRKNLIPTVAKTALEEAKRENVPIALVLAILRQETVSLDPKAVSSVGARGLMQVMPGTWEGLGGGSLENAFDPVTNIRMGVKYLGQMYRQFNGDLKTTLVAYNAGPGRAKTYLKDGTMPKETRKYVPKVTSFYEHYLDYEKTTGVLLARK